MSDILWMKFPDEALCLSFPSEEDKEKLQQTFAADDQNSAWSKAVHMLGLYKAGTNAPLIKWHHDVPYFNWSYMTPLISGGVMNIEKTEENGYKISAQYKALPLLHLMKNQWHTTKFENSLDSREDNIVLSIALGLVIQAAILRLGAAPDTLAHWLAAPEKAPEKHLPLLQKLQQLQIRRTEISAVWDGVIPRHVDNEPPRNLPDYFWNEYTSQNIEAEKERDKDNWKGLPVCAGLVTGIAVHVTKNINTEQLVNIKQKYNAPLILVFHAARPETVDYFPLADAVIYGTGGALSHACTVAREMNIPCITGLGDSITGSISKGQNVWLTIDGAQGLVNRFCK